MTLANIVKFFGRYFVVNEIINLTVPCSVTITNHVLEQGSYNFKFAGGEATNLHKILTGLSFIFRDTHATELMYLGLKQKAKTYPKIEATNTWAVAIPYGTILSIGRIDGIPSLPYTSWDFSDELSQRPIIIDPMEEISLTYNCITCLWHTQICYVNVNGFLARELSQEEINHVFEEHRLPA